MNKPAPAASVAVQREAHQTWLAVRQILESRNLCQRLKNGTVRHVSYTGWTYLESIRAFAFVIDTRRLPIPLEHLDDPKVAHALSTGLAGRHVHFTNHRGLALVVGRDLPAPTLPPVRLPHTVDLDLSQRPAGRYRLALGVGHAGPMWLSLETACHIMIGGSSDSGKSAMLRSILYQLMSMPEPVVVALADMEGRTFGAFEGLPRVKFPVADDVDSATRITTWLLDEMERRGGMFDATGRYPEKWSEYMAIPGVEPLPWIVAVFDEFTALLDTAGKNSELYHHVGQLAMRSRKYGITLVYAGQDFKSDLVNSRVTNQVRTRIAHRCATRFQAENITGQPGTGAERITVPGRAVAVIAGQVQELQGYWLPPDRILALRQPGQTPAPMRVAGLTPPELAVFTEAITCRNGLMRIEDIARHAAQLGIKPSAARERADRWERLEYIEKRPPNNARYVTAEFEDRLRASGAFADQSQTLSGDCEPPFAKKGERL